MATKTYEKLSQREHVLLRPDTYIGTTDMITSDMWIYNNYNIVKENITYNPGLFKIFDEILINARDASVNDNTCNNISIEYNKDQSYISIYNNGNDGIPILKHDKYDCLIPTMIFGELLTSSSYDDTVKRTTGSRNGIGSKACNIFSKKFIVEIDDVGNKKKFSQIWENNMSIVNKPIINKLPASVKNSMVKVTFYPDCERFSLKEGLDDYHYSLFYKRAFDIAGTTNNKVKIFFNNTKININDFKSYIKLYNYSNTLYYDEGNENWKIGVIINDDKNGEFISFVNGINTYNGGSHCNYISDIIIKPIITEIKKKDKNFKLTFQSIKDNFIFFINATIVNPSFSSQSKDTLTSKIENFGSVYNLNNDFINKIVKSGIIKQLLELSKIKEQNILKKTDGKKQSKIIGIPKLEDANKAGTREGYKCTLILTEGDSAKSTAMAGVSVLSRDYYGVFPLKGKLLNVRDASLKQLTENEEIKNIKIILGLKQSENYDNLDKLRYGSIICLTDQDYDGSHIKGLIINMFHSLWPSLITNFNFIKTLATPIVVVTKGKIKYQFYNLLDYENWKNTDNIKGFNIKYYKGLGTSTSIEAKEYFTNIDKKIISFHYKNENDDKDIELAFSKTKADDRKEWLKKYNKNDILDTNNKNITYSNFIHKELIHFSNDDLSRSIPSIIDGLKISQRKILYGSFLRGLDKDEIKVAQLAGFVSDKACYHHGEMSLNMAIVGMAQNFMGSNNINILAPNGQYGTRLLGGKDYASSRYIWTKFEELTSYIFNSHDNPVLNHQTDDGIPIEPEFYAPIIPMILVNGTEGIGTGFSTKIAQYNPIDIINNIKNLLNGKKLFEIEPYWNKFTGSIVKIDNNNYEINGTYKIVNNKVIITELPVGTWTTNYKEFLEKLLNDKKKNNIILSYSDNNTDEKIYFEIKFADNYLKNNFNDIPKLLHLTKKYSTNNMHLFNKDNIITKYTDIKDIFNEYYYVRLDIYNKRKQYQLSMLKFQSDLLTYKAKFILMIVDEKIIINKQKRKDIENDLENNDFPKMGKIYNDDNLTYDYLLTMPLYNLTKEKIDEILKHRDNKQTEYDNLFKKDIKNIWLDELNELEKKYLLFIKKNT